MKDGASVCCDDKSAKIAMRIRKEAGAPVVAWRKRNFKWTQFHRLPVIELVHDVETELMHQIPHAYGHDDGLICCNAPQSAPVEMIEVSVGDEDQVNGRQMMNFEAWSLQSFDHLEPLRPDRIDQYINVVGLNEK